jgi:hypothetical protein
MAFEFEDEKGKVFTEVITKIPILITMQTTTHQVVGKIHIRPDQRIKSELDYQEPFIAVTDASVLDVNGKVLYHTDFMAVRRDQIVWVIPSEGDR